MSELSVGQLRGLTVNDNVITVPSGHILRAPSNVLQVVSVHATTQVTSSSGTYSDSGLSATITPRFANSRIFVTVSQTIELVSIGSSGGTSSSGEIRLLRGGTQLFQTLLSLNAALNSASTPNIASTHTHPINFLDSPATTSPVTYSMQQRLINGFYISSQIGGRSSTITLMEIAS